MNFLYYSVPILWFLYLSAYELRVQLLDKGLKEEGKLVNPEFKTLSHLRYLSAIPAIVITLLLATLLVVLVPFNLINFGFASVLLFLINPILSWVCFYFISKYLITKAKLEKLNSTLEE